MTRRTAYDGVVAVCPTTIAYSRYSIRTAQWWIGSALRELAAAAGLRAGDIDGFCISSFTLGPDTAVGLTQHLGLSPRWLDHIPMGGACGVVALRRAARAVQCGDADIVACLAGDTNGPDSFRTLVSGFSRFAADATYPYGGAGPNGSFALLTDAYMRAHGATRADFGRICVAQRANAAHNPNALLRQPLTLDDYLAARMISDPVALFDCVMPCAGAEGFLVMREATARAMGLPAVAILSTIERHNGFAEDPVQLRGGWAMDVPDLYAMAGLAPGGIDVVQTYDDYPVIVMMQFEDLGFCAKGEGPAFVRAHDLTIGGSFPHNTGGGQLSAGQAGAAGGYLGLVEAMRQLTRTAGGTQVARARTALVSGFGMINYDRGLCAAAAILAAA